MEPHDRPHRRPWLLALLALLLIGAATRFALFRVRPAQDELVHVSSVRVFPPVAETLPPIARAAGQAAPAPAADSLAMWRKAPLAAKNTLEDLMGLFEGGAASDGSAADVAKDPEFKSAVDRLRRTGDVQGFLNDPKAAPRLGALLRAHAAEPRFAAYIASRQLLVALAARAGGASVGSHTAAAGPEAHAVRALAGAKAVGDARLTRIDCGASPPLYQAYFGLDPGKRARFDPLVRGMLGGDDIHELCRKSGFAETCEEKLACCQRDSPCRTWASQRFLGPDASARAPAGAAALPGTPESGVSDYGAGTNPPVATGRREKSSTTRPPRGGPGSPTSGAAPTGGDTTADTGGATAPTSTTGSTSQTTTARTATGGAGGDDLGGSTGGGGDCTQTFYGCGSGGVPAYFQKTCCADDGTGCSTTLIAGQSPYCKPQSKPPDPCFDCGAWRSGCEGHQDVSVRDCPATAPGCETRKVTGGGMCALGGCPQGQIYHQGDKGCHLPP